jgi:hypothetical protein
MFCLFPYASSYDIARFKFCSVPPVGIVEKTTGFILAVDPAEMLPTLNTLGPRLTVEGGDDDEEEGDWVATVVVVVVVLALVLPPPIRVPPTPVTVTITPVACAEPVFLTPTCTTLETPGITLNIGGGEELEGDEEELEGVTKSKTTFPLILKGTEIV